MVFQIGLVEAISQVEDLEKRIPFDVARENFYQACRYGFNAEITWLDGKKETLQNLLYNEWVAKAGEALNQYHIAKEDIQKYIYDIIYHRVQSGQNGANWQKAFVSTHGYCFQEMLEKYYEYQKQNLPVHHWKA